MRPIDRLQSKYYSHRLGNNQYASAARNLAAEVQHRSEIVKTNEKMIHDAFEKSKDLKKSPMAAFLIENPVAGFKKVNITLHDRFFDVWDKRKYEPISQKEANVFVRMARALQKQDIRQKK